MFRTIVGVSILTSLLFVATAGAGAAPSARPAPPAVLDSAAAEGWPTSRAGVLSAGWVHAFSAGEREMKEFLAKHLAPKSLEEAAMPRRVERYRALREKYGELKLASVVGETATELTVKLVSSDAELHEFVFKIQEHAPYQLVSVSIRESHGFGFGGFHH